MQATRIKTAQPMGAYRPTVLDARKAAAEFLLTGTRGNRLEVRWADGRSRLVTERQLATLQAAHAWATDF